MSHEGGDPPTFAGLGTEPSTVPDRSAWRVSDVAMADPEDVLALFQVIAGEPHFSPHPFDREAVARIAGHRGRDRYLVGRFGKGALVAYGMLRGWDAGYDVPSLGISVHPSVRGRGVGALMMETLHAEALRAGARAVRLRVHPHNMAALGLYERFGYTRSGEERGQMVLIRPLP